MSQAFGWTMDHLERQVVALIEAGEIQARVDKQNQVRRLFFTFFVIRIELDGFPSLDFESKGNGSTSCALCSRSQSWNRYGGCESEALASDEIVGSVPFFI